MHWALGIRWRAVGQELERAQRRLIALRAIGRNLLIMTFLRGKNPAEKVAVRRTGRRQVPGERNRSRRFQDEGKLKWQIDR